MFRRKRRRGGYAGYWQTESQPGRQFAVGRYLKGKKQLWSVRIDSELLKFLTEQTKTKLSVLFKFTRFDIISCA